MHSVRLLGRDHQRYGDVEAQHVGADLAAAISVGADLDSPSMQFKSDPDFNNEDALCAVVHNGVVGVAVADAHFGLESSHVLIAQLHDAWAQSLPHDLASLIELAGSLGSKAHTRSETAMLVVVHDLASGRGFGLSVGDASLHMLGADSSASTAINPRNNRYVNATGKGLCDQPFTFATAPGELVTVFTDGIDECHYRNPETSVRPRHLAAIANRVDHSPLPFVREVAELALHGVDGHPGGQDNIAIAAWSA